jgi:hypothetical protein
MKGRMNSVASTGPCDPDHSYLRTAVVSAQFYQEVAIVHHLDSDEPCGGINVLRLPPNGPAQRINPERVRPVGRRCAKHNNVMHFQNIQSSADNVLARVQGRCMARYPDLTFITRTSSLITSRA